MKTASQLMRAGGLDRRGVARLQELGIIPKPLNMAVGSGRGRRGYWPDETIETVRRVREQRERGMTLEHIAASARTQFTIDSNFPSPGGLIWGQPGKAGTRLAELLASRTFTVGEGEGAVTQTGLESLRDGLGQQLYNLRISEAEIDGLVSKLTTDARLGFALELHIRGIDPVGIVVGFGRAYVTADFLVSHEISAFRKMVWLADPVATELRQKDLAAFIESTESAWSGCVIVPLMPLLYHVLRKCQIQVSQGDSQQTFLRKFLPAEQVVVSDDTVAMVCDITLIPVQREYGTYAFDLTAAGKKRVIAGRPRRKKRDGKK